MMEPRSRFMLLLGAGAFVAILVALFFFSSEPRLQTSQSREEVERTPQEIRSSWNTGVTAVLLQYDQDADAEAAKNGLLALTVPSEERDLHLSLVLAFQAVVTGQNKAAEKLVEARAAFAKLDLSQP